MPNQSKRVWYDAIIAFAKGCHSEVTRCAKARAYLAGCVLLGAAWEAALLAMMRMCTYQVYQRGKRLSQQWRLKDLNDLAKECGWLDQTGYDAAERIRQSRNLLHPERAAASPKVATVKKRDLNNRWHDFQAAMDQLYHYVV